MPVRRPWRLGAAFTLILGTLLRPASATSELTGGNPCGDNGVCAVPLGTYRLLLPPSGEVRGVYVFFHGFQSSATEAVRDRRLTETLFAHGLALAAPESIGRTWSHPNATTADRDDIAFSGQILDDLADWLGFTGERVILGGFSRGASMAWYAACAFGERVGGVVTFSGVFWEPLPTAADCPGAPSLRAYPRPGRHGLSAGGAGGAGRTAARRHLREHRPPTDLGSLLRHRDLRARRDRHGAAFLRAGDRLRPRPDHPLPPRSRTYLDRRVAGRRVASAGGKAPERKPSRLNRAVRSRFLHVHTAPITGPFGPVR